MVTDTTVRTRRQTVLLAVTVVFTIVMFFPAVPPSVPGKLKVAGLILLGVWLVAIWRRPGCRLLWREHPVIGAGSVGLAVWTAASALWAVDRSTALGAASRMAAGILLMVIVYTVASDRGASRVLGLAYALGAVLSIAYGVILRPGPPIPGAVFDPTRLYGGMGEPNDLAAVLLPAVAITVFAIPRVRTLLQRVAMTVLACALLAGVALAQSRGAFVAAAVMLVAGIASAGRYRMRLAAAAGAVVVLSVGYVVLFAPQAVHRRLNSLLRADVYGGVADGSGRRELWEQAIALFPAHPLTGVGAHNYRSVTGEALVVHNTYLEILVELGLVGLVLFSIVLGGVVVRAGRRIRRSPDGWTATLPARGAVVGLVGLLTAFVFISGEFTHQLWWLLGYALACAAPVTERGPDRHRERTGLAILKP